MSESRLEVLSEPHTAESNGQKAKVLQSRYVYTSYMTHMTKVAQNYLNLIFTVQET